MINRIAFDEKLKNDWPEVPNPFLTYEWYATWFETLGQDWEPYFLQVGNIIAPLAKKAGLVIFAGDTSVTDYHDLVGPKGEIETAWAEIISKLKSEKIRKIRLDSIRQDSQSYVYLKNNTDFKVIQENTTPILKLPQTWDDYLASLDNHYRHELRRKMRRFEEKFPELKIVTTNDVTPLFRLMKLNPSKKKFLTPAIEDFLRKVTAALSKQTLLKNLIVNNQIAAATISFIHGGTHYLYNSGFDDQHFSGAGFYLNIMLIKEAIESRLTEFNFLRGQERYKYDLGAKDLPIYTATWRA